MGEDNGAHSLLRTAFGNYFLHLALVTQNPFWYTHLYAHSLSKLKMECFVLLGISDLSRATEMRSKLMGKWWAGLHPNKNRTETFSESCCSGMDTLGPNSSYHRQLTRHLTKESKCFKFSYSCSQGTWNVIYSSYKLNYSFRLSLTGCSGSLGWLREALQNFHFGMKFRI